MSSLLLFLLIPICAFLNHLGGQSTTIPSPRVVCRMIAPGIAFGIIAYFTGMAPHLAIAGGTAVVAGLSFWAVWPWGQGFMSITGQDSRNYEKMKWICLTCDEWVGCYPGTKLTATQCKAWGTVYMTIRGLFLLPMFTALALLFTPWALVLGLPCVLQGAIYRLCGRFGAYSVFVAEYITGALLIGAPLATILKAIGG